MRLTIKPGLSWAERVAVVSIVTIKCAALLLDKLRAQVNKILLLIDTLWAIAKDYAMNANSDESFLLAKLTDKGQVK